MRALDIRIDLRNMALALVLAAALAAPAAAGYLGGFTLESGAQAWLGHGQPARVDFQFKVTNHNGAVFRVAAYEQGAEVPGIVADNGGLHPAGTVAEETVAFTFTAGDVHVDEVRVTMLDPIGKVPLLEMSLPVDYTYGTYAVNGIHLSGGTPAWLRKGVYMDIGFSYFNGDAEFVRITARPYRNGSPAPGSVSSGAVVLVPGEGTAGQFFTLNGDGDVDEVRFTVWEGLQNVILQEFSLPVDLHFGDHSFTNIRITPESGTRLAWDQHITVEFDYDSGDSNGCRVWAFGRSATLGGFPGMHYHGSAPQPESGHAMRQFWIASADGGEGEWAYVRLQMSDEPNTNTLLVVDIPVSYPFGARAVNDVVCTPASPAVLNIGEPVHVAYAYTSFDSTAVHLQAWGVDAGADVPGQVSYLSPVFGAGSVGGLAYFTVPGTPQAFDGLRLGLVPGAGQAALQTFDLPADYRFVPLSLVTAAPDLPAAAPALGQNFPNPFNPVTHIPVDLAASGRVALKVYDLRGHLVRVLADGVLPAGRTEMTLDGRDLASGAYLYALETPWGRETRRMTLLK